MISPRDIYRRVIGLLPLIAVGGLFVAPLVIWLVKDNASAIETVELPGNVVDITNVPASDGTLVERVRVRLQDGSIVIVEDDVDDSIRPGATITVVKTLQDDGTVSYYIEED